MFMTQIIKDIQQKIIEKYPDGSEVTGAELGVLIRGILPQEQSLKTQFGGLKRLIKEHFSDQIEELGASGKDRKYKINISHSDFQLKNEKSNYSARDLLRHAIDHLSDEQIQKIELPLEIVLKVLSQFR